MLTRKRTATAEHRPATRKRTFRHDELTAVDLLSGFGGLTDGVKRAGFTAITAANHNRYKVEVHEANHPEVEHWIADLSNRESSDYHSVRELPAADLLVAGVTCFAAGSMVLSRRGLVPIEGIAVGDEVWTHRSRWRPVTHVSAAQRTTINVNATTPITCTPDHPFIAANGEQVRQPKRRYQPLDSARCIECGGGAPQFRQTATARLYCSRNCSQAAANRRALPVLGEAREVRADRIAGTYIASPILDAGDAELPEIDGLGPVTAELAWVLGRWVGDGWLSRRPERHNAWSRVTICGSHDEGDVLAKELAARTDLPWNRTRLRTTDTFHVSRVGFADFLADQFGHGAAGKRLPVWLLFAPEPIRRAFLDGYMSADGHETREGLRIQSASVSKALSVGVRLLLTSLGYYATVTYVEPPRFGVIEGRTVRQRPQWVVSGGLCREKRPKHRDRDGYRWGKPSGTVTPGDVITVYNMTVAEDHTYVVDGVLVHNCTNHSQANTQKAYVQAMSLFDLDDPEFDERATRSERDRATANCALHYAAEHHPRMVLIECTTELTSWGPALPGKRKVGDGSTYRWWLKEFGKLGYKHRVLYLNSMFFYVPQSRNRLYIAFWDKRIPTPDLDHRPIAWCGHCDQAVESVWSWRTGVPPTGSVSYGKQYDYRCPRCHHQVFPPVTPSIVALDLSNLGTRIGDKPIKTFKDGYVGPLARATMERAERCRQRFADFPAVLMPAKAARGSARHLLQSMSTQTSQQETALLTTGAVIAAHRHNGDGKNVSQPMDTVTSTHEKACVFSPPVALAVDNYQGRPRGVDEVLATQTGSQTMALVSSGVIPYRKHTTSAACTEAMPTVTAGQIPGLLTAAGVVQYNQGTDRRISGVGQPLRTQVADNHNALLFSGWNDAALATEWRQVLADLRLEDCFIRMMAAHEVGWGCGFDCDRPGYQGTFKVWGSARDQVDGFGNAVSPQVGEWIGSRLRAALHGEASP